MPSPVGSSPKWQPKIAESARWVAHRNSRNAWGAADEKAEAAAPDGVISREELLSGRMVSKRHPLAHLPGTYCLRAEAIAPSPPAARPAPPPGLELPDSEAVTKGVVTAELEADPTPEKAKKQFVADKTAPDVKETIKQLVVDPPAPEVSEYKVLLQNMPDAMLKECMLRAMLEQGNLKDVKNLVFRANGKVLITFASYDSVPKCVKHFHGRNWGGSVPVSATYVFVAPPKEERQALAASKAPPMVAVKATPLNVNAAVFVPLSKKSDSYNMFHRQISDTSTDAGPASEGASEACDLDSVAQGA